MSLLPVTSHANPTSTFFNPVLPCGVTGTLTWSAGASGTFSASITNVSPQLTANSQVTASVQSSSLADGLAAWLVNAVPTAAANGTITFIAAANPGTPSTFRISWIVDKF